MACVSFSRSSSLLQVNYAFFLVYHHGMIPLANGKQNNMVKNNWGLGIYT